MGGSEVTATQAQVRGRTECGVVNVEGSAIPSPLPSRPAISQVVGMNCMGPTARSHTASPSSTPSSVSGMAAKLPPSRLGPITGPLTCPVSDKFPPPWLPCADSTKPMAATVFQPIRHAGVAVLASSAAAA
jgi:hypothetical protein